MRRLSARRYLLLALLASAAMLATAHAFQRFGGYAPCPLCLRQREVYWGAMLLAGVGLALVASGDRRKGPLFAALIAAAFAAGALVAGFHAGVELRWFAAPGTCGGSGPADPSAIEAMLRGAKVRMPRCDEVAWSFLGLSMAGWNMLVSLALAALGLIAARNGRG